jgi:hypothetical protein
MDHLTFLCDGRDNNGTNLVMSLVGYQNLSALEGKFDEMKKGTHLGGPSS